MATRFMTDPHAMRGHRAIRDANNYEQQEHASQQILSS